MGVGKIFSRGLLWIFPKIFLGWPKVVKFVFCHSKERKQRFLLKFSNSCPPSDQARSHLGTPGEAMSFLRGAQIFKISFKLCPNTFSKGGESFSGWIACTPPSYAHASNTHAYL